MRSSVAQTSLGSFQQIGIYAQSTGPLLAVMGHELAVARAPSLGVANQSCVLQRSCTRVDRDAPGLGILVAYSSFGGRTPPFGQLSWSTRRHGSTSRSRSTPWRRITTAWSSPGIASATESPISVTCWRSRAPACAVDAPSMSAATASTRTPLIGAMVAAAVE